MYFNQYNPNQLLSSLFSFQNKMKTNSHGERIIICRDIKRDDSTGGRLTLADTKYPVRNSAEIKAF